jgi:hypothetical protein
MGVSVEYNMMRKLKSVFANSASALAVGVAVFALSFASVHASHAEDLQTTSCPLPIDVMDATVAEEIDVLCHSADQTKAMTTAVSEEFIRPPDPAETPPPAVVEGIAAPTEITTTVTVAVLGESDEDHTGSVPAKTATAETAIEQEPIVDNCQ